MRHLDFERIYKEFVNYYKNSTVGESEYYAWLKTLQLDETKEYGFACESFKWAKDMLKLLREDADNKYYKILLGFPIKSMNGNVYRERDLIAAALSLKGKHPSLNHKDEFHFSPDNHQNKWGVLTVVDGKYEDNAAEAILQVPKDAICPICDGAKMTELIDSQRIVNVSLEGECLGGVCYDGTCEGFTFSDPPFTLLTSDVLPGIPLARIKPLEAYLPFSQSSINKRKPKMKKKIVIKPKRIEDNTAGTATIVQPPVNVNTGSKADPNFKGTFGTPIKTDSALHSETQSSGNVTVPVGMSPGNYQMKSGTTLTHTPPTTPTESVKEPLTDYTNQEDCEANGHHWYDNACHSEPKSLEPQEQAEPEFADHQGPYAPMDGPSDDEKMPKPEDIRTGAPKTAPPEDSDVEFPEGAPTMLPSSETTTVDVGTVPAKDSVKVGDAPAEQVAEPCPEGQHRDELDNCVADTAEQETPLPPCPEGEHRNDEGECVPTDTSEQVEEPCEDGYHKDAEGNCVPDEPLDERVKRIKAETKQFMAEAESAKLRKDMKNVETVWTSKYVNLDKALQKQQMYNRSQSKIVKHQRKIIRDEQLRAEDLRVELRGFKNQFADATSLSTKYMHLNEDLNIALEGLKKKYHGLLQTRLEDRQALTASEEDYVKLGQLKDELLEKLKKARIHAKKTLKLRV